MTGKNDYEIGYGKPPKSGRFRKGASGNPKGRPKEARNFRTDVREVLNAKVAITENGRTRRVTSQKATLMRLREKALKGDARAMEKLIELAREQTIEDLALQVERGLATTEESILARYAEALLDSRGIGNTEDTVEDNIAGEVSDET